MSFEWKVFYDDGSTFGNADGPPELAPTRGVQGIIQVDVEHGSRIEKSNDYYVWWENEWRGLDIFGLWDYLTQPGYSLVIFGRLISHIEYRKLLQTIIDDYQIPNKTGFQRGERR